MQWIRVWSFGVGLTLVAGAAASAPFEGTLLIANRDGGSISLIDLPTRAEIARLPVGPRIPHEVSVSPDGRFALTGEYGPGNGRGHHLVVIDIPGARILGRIDLGEGTRPHSTVFLPDSRRAVSTMEDADRLALVDVTTREVIRTYPTGGREGHMVRLSPDGRRAYVTSRGAEGTLSVIFLEEEERAPVVIPTGRGAEGLAVAPDGSEIWVVNRQAASISIVDAERLEVVETVPSRPFAGRAEMSASGRVVVPNGTGGETERQYLRVYDAQSRRVLQEVALDDEAGQGAFGVLIREDLVFVTDRARDRILLFDLNDPRGLEVFRTSHDAPDGMAWSPLRVAVLAEPGS